MDYSIIILVAAAVGIVALIIRTQVTTTTVFEYERGLRFVQGRLRDELGPGRYRHSKTQTTIVKVDTRPVQIAVNSQEVLSRDGVAIKASLTATYEVVDARAAVLKSASYVAALHAELQQGLRAAVSSADVETLLANRADLGPAILQACASAVAPIGLRLTAVAVRDLTLPGELKKIFSQVVKARQEGLAALERARGETAALRNLANAAQLVERNPQLFQLRLLQVAGQQPGTTLVVGLPPGVAAVPMRQPSDPGTLPPANGVDGAGE